jgi:glucose/mannose-6-phosphate isomerase
MPHLDDASLERTYDPGGMLRSCLDFPGQVRRAWTIGMESPLAPLRDLPTALVLAGMGGSAIGGDFLGALLGRRLRIPLVVVRDSRLPSFVGPRSIVIASSYSGETEETLALASEASAAGATLLAVTSGGRLAEIAERRGSTLRIPDGRSPRASLGYLMVPALAALERWGLAGPWGDEVEGAASVLEEVASGASPEIPTPQNPAKRLAEHLLGRVPAVYAACPDVEPAARRWKCQFNENSKTLATWNVFPELAHNETVGWEAPPEVAAMFAVVVLLAGDEPERLLRQVRLARDLVFRPGGGIHDVRGRGPGRLARLLSLVLLGDLTSVYLAYLRGVDPTPTRAIEALKRGLRGDGEGRDPHP